MFFTNGCKFMEVKHYRDEDGYWFKEIIYKSYGRLKELKDQYEMKGDKVWLNPWDDKRWVLTVKSEVY